MSNVPDLTPQQVVIRYKSVEQLRWIQRQSMRINQVTPISGSSTINDQQASVRDALNLKKPSKRIAAAY